MISDASMEAHSVDVTSDEQPTNEPRGAESSGKFKGGYWKLYPAKEKGVITGYVIHVWVRTGTWKKARLPRSPETSTPRTRERWCKEAAPAIFRAWHEAASRPKQETSPAPEARAISFFAFAKLWTSEELREQYPDHVRRKKEYASDKARLEWMQTVIGDVSIRDFTIDHGEKIMRALPREYEPTTRRHYGQTIMTVLAYAVFPARLIPVHPLPKNWLGPGKAKNYLYPDEEETLISCAEKRDDGEMRIPLLRRFYYAFLSREGCRRTEALDLTWSDLDLERGVLKLDENKSDDPRSWAIDPGVVEALKVWRDHFHPHGPRGEKDGPKVPPTSLVFLDETATRFRRAISRSSSAPISSQPA